MSWQIAAIIYSLMHAGFALVNQKFKIPGAVLGMWRGFGIFLALLPFSFFVTAPTSILFYVFVGINGILSGLSDNLYFEMSSRYNAGALLRFRPLSLIALILLWWIIYPEGLLKLLETPWIFTGVMLALACIPAAIFFIKKIPFSREALAFYTPLILLSTLVAFFNKMSMDQGEVESAIFYYILIQGAINGLTNTTLYLRHPDRKTFPSLFSKKVIKAGIAIIIALVGMQVAKNYAMKFTPNPAYVQAISYLSAVWATGFNWIRGIKDKSNIWAEFLLVFAAVALIALTKL